MLPLIFILHFNCLVIAKVYSGIQMFRQSVPLSFILTAQLSQRFTVASRRFVGVPPLPSIISVSHFNCLVITKAYSGIEMFRRSAPLLSSIISVFHFN